jgi:hypothetical protein
MVSGGGPVSLVVTERKSLRCHAFVELIERLLVADEIGVVLDLFFCGIVERIEFLEKTLAYLISRKAMHYINTMFDCGLDGGRLLCGGRRD